MIIAIDTRFLGTGRRDAGRSFDVDQLLPFVKENDQHRFLFLSDKVFDAEMTFPKNVTALVTGPGIKNGLLMQYWFNYRLPPLLKKQKADVFVSLDGICSLRTEIPQCIVIPDTSFLQYPLYFRKANARYYKKNTAAFIAKAKAVATVSEFSRKVLVDHCKTDPSKIEVIHEGAAGMYVPLGQEEKENVRETHADGKEYFLCSGNDNPRSNLVNLLKAFSFFKKRQKSSMLLLVTGNPGEDLMKRLKTYKYRDEVKVLQRLTGNELAGITAAACAVVHPVLYEDAALVPFRAMQCGVPLVCSAAGSLPEVCDDAALYANPDDFEDIAQMMMTVFKDEDKARDMARTGMKRAGIFQNSKAGELLGSLIKKAVNG
ncbi:MAG: glycosyltransferase family 4 protein [Chitinophagaceae bacterium]|nr:glycosyltransferase family 4 protein [Chitinophagaceae bacterium]